MNTAPRKQPETGLFRPVWREFNRLLDYVREISPTTGRGIKVTRTLNNTIVTADIPRAERGEPGVVKAYDLVSVGNDSYQCTEVGSGELVTIAKPKRLRRTGWDGETVTLNDGNGAPYDVEFTYASEVKRTIQIGTYTEDQVIVPGYMPEVDVIFASVSENGTGLVGVELIDLNVEGRAWARSRLQTTTP